MNHWQLEIRDSGVIVVDRLMIADRFWSRLCGLQFRRPLPPRHGFLLAPCNSIHTMWMRFSIDVAMLDRAGQDVLAVRRAVRPWRLLFAPARHACTVLEAAETFAAFAGRHPGGSVRDSGPSSPPASLAGFSGRDLNMTAEIRGTESRRSFPDPRPFTKLTANSPPASYIRTPRGTQENWRSTPARASELGYARR